MGGAGGAAATSTTVTAEMRREADLALLDAVRAQTSFASSAEVTVGGRQFGLGGADIKEELDNQRFPHKELVQVMNTPEHELLAMPHDELHQLMKKVANLAQGPKKLFNLEEAVVQAVRNEGKVDPPAEPPTTLGDMVRGVGRDYAFGGIAYDPSRTATPEEIETVYEGEASISRLVNAGKLASVTAPKDEFDKLANALQAQLREANTEHMRMATTGGRKDPDRMARDIRDAQALLRATQLKRRWIVADKNREPEPEPELPTNTNNTMVMTPEAMIQLLQANAQQNNGPGGGNPNNIINGNP